MTWRALSAAHQMGTCTMANTTERIGHSGARQFRMSNRVCLAGSVQGHKECQLRAGATSSKHSNNQTHNMAVGGPVASNVVH